jgi:hypothetical protein
MVNDRPGFLLFLAGCEKRFSSSVSLRKSMVMSVLITMGCFVFIPRISVVAAW